jgi:lactoylglutathione lyase
MPTVKKLLHTRMRVNDIEATVKFYTEALGLTETRRHTSPRGAQLAFLATPNSEEEIEICQMPPGAPSVEVQSDLMHLAFEVDDLMAFAAEAKAKGYELSDGPTKSGSGMIAFFDAPEGYEVELIERTKK